MTDQEYLRDGIRRIETGEVQAGSHAAGIFGRCAAEFEGEVRVWFTHLLRSCGLEYDRDIKAHCRGAVIGKTTLGNLIAGVERAAVLKADCVGRRIPPPNDVGSFVRRLSGINADWVRMKHREEVGTPTILDRMKCMAVILDGIAAGPQSGRDV
jgi:hypothetical protein